MRCRPAARATPMLNSSSIRLRRRESVSLGRSQNCNLLEMDHFRRHGVEDESQLQPRFGFWKHLRRRLAPPVTLQTTRIWRHDRFGRIKGLAMLNTDQINDLHRFYWSDRWPIRKIERHLRMGWRTIKKYLDMPAQTPAGRPRTSKLDSYKATIAELLEKDPS